jgi:hypothetical protein
MARIIDLPAAIGLCVSALAPQLCRSGAYRSGKKTVTSNPTHFRKKRENGWGTLTVFGCRINNWGSIPALPR